MSCFAKFLANDALNFQQNPQPKITIIYTSFAFSFAFKCCPCFGPQGGRKNYCGPKCTAINGETVMKKAFVVSGKSAWNFE